MEHKSNIGVPMPEIDYLVCGSCQQDFPLQNIVLFMQHKKFDCDDFRTVKQVHGLSSRLLLCQSCPRKFTTPWRLLQHAQHVHALFIYMEEELAIRRADPCAPAHDAVISSSDAGIQTDLSTQEPIGFTQTRQSFVTRTAREPTQETTAPRHSLPRTMQSIDVASASTRPRDQQDNPPTGTTKSVLLGGEGRFNVGANVKPDVYYGFDVQDSLQSASAFQVSDKTQITIDRFPADSLERTKEMDLVDYETKDEEIKSSEYECDKERRDVIGNKSKIVSSKECDTKVSTEGGVKGEEREEEESKCCDNQACGITLMPGTHEEPRKCCVAVVPKKRKRHMQTKHMSGRRKSGERLKRSGDTNVIIDIDSSLGSYITSPNKVITSQSTSDGSQPCSVTLQSSPPRRTNEIPISKEKSVIIEPGTTFSIPVPFSRSRTTVESCAFIDQRSELVPCTTVRASPQVQSSKLDIAVGEDPGTLDQPTDGVPSTVEIGDVSYNLPRNKKRKYPTSRPFKCDQCDQAFNQRIHLRKHQSKHTGVKPFQCQQCDYSTVEKSHLKVHIRVHTGEKPFKCTYCEYATAQNSTLNIHLKRHHMGATSSTTKCTDCGIDCENQSQLQIHVNQQHRNSSSQSRPSTVDQS